jgi:hypothetical protein
MWKTIVTGKCHGSSTLFAWDFEQDNNEIN